MALAFATSLSFGSREDIPISAVASITEATPVDDPSAAISNATSTPCLFILALKASAICGTILAPRVSEPLMTIVSIALTVPIVITVTVIRLNRVFFIFIFLVCIDLF